MPTPTTIPVKTIYGWGWVIAGKPRFEVPQPFTMSLDERSDQSWAGIVQDEDHEFHGRRVSLSQRHVEWSGMVNVEVEAGGTDEAPSYGFAKLAELPPTV